MVWLRLRDPTLLFPPFWPLFISNTHFPALFSQKEKGRGGIFVRRNLLFYLKQKRRVGKSQISTLVAFLCVLPPPMLGRGMLLTTFSLLSHGEKIGRASYACPSPEADWGVCLDRPLFIFVLAIWDMRKFYHSSKAEMLWTRIFSFDVMDWFDWTLGF